MTPTLNLTHDAARRSWVEPANDPAGDFPLQNLPAGIFHTAARSDPRSGIAIGDQILDLASAGSAGLLPTDVIEACRQPTLSALMALGPAAWSTLRGRLSELLGADTCPAGPLRSAVADCLVPMRDAVMLLPAHVGDYTDFYASLHHATNVGAMFRPDSPLLPNYKWVPVGYHGRASSLVVSGTPVRRPRLQSNPSSSPAPSFGPCHQLDYELELAAFVGPGNTLGTPLPLARAEENIFGVCLLNDWSARDLQAWEYQPLGPFLAKNFATTVSPWVVSLEALAPFRTPAPTRPAGDPAPLPYLASAANQAQGGLDLTLEVFLLTPPDAPGRRRATPAFPRQFFLDVLDARPTADAPRQQRLQPPARRPARQRHRVRPGEKLPRLPARTHRARPRAGGAARRRSRRRFCRMATRSSFAVSRSVPVSPASGWANAAESSCRPAPEPIQPAVSPFRRVVLARPGGRRQRPSTMKLPRLIVTALLATALSAVQPVKASAAESPARRGQGNAEKGGGRDGGRLLRNG